MILFSRRSQLSRNSPNSHEHFLYVMKQQLKSLKAYLQELNPKIANYMSIGFKQTSDQFIV